MSEYILKFPKPDVSTREEYDAHTDELDRLRKAIYEEMSRVEKIRVEKNLKKVRFGPQAGVK
ncbi:MAG: hypothetical protein ACWGQW_02875 [bacterium]